MSSSTKTADPQALRKGFTLIEILLVIAVMAILGTIITGASRKLVQTARTRRAKVTINALNVALHRYRTEYQRWPVDPDDSPDSTSTRSGTSAYTGYKWHEWKASNHKIFDALRTCNDGEDMNPDGIRFLDETTLFTKDGDKLVPLSQVASATGNTLCYAGRKDNKPKPFIVWICFETDEAEVGPRDLDNGKDDDDSYGY